MRRRFLPFALVGLIAFAAPAHAVNDPARTRQWSLDRVGAEAAWKVADGKGITVAVIDSGVDLAHEDLAGQLVPGHDFFQADDQPQDGNGHGTHVAGIVAAAGDNGKGVVGVAPGAKVMPVRVLDENGDGDFEDVVAGVRWAVSHGAKVINLSLSEQTQALFGSGLADVLTDAWKAGVIPVVAAGNQFVTDSGFSDEPVVVVAATNRSDGKPTYSSAVGAARWGIAAPGGELPDLGTDGAILSTYWTGEEPNQYGFLAGTSQAAPMVSGALAVLLSTGRFTPEQAVRRLLETATDIGPPGRDATFGAGRLDLAAAVKGLGGGGGGGGATTTTVAPAPSTTMTAPATPAPSGPSTLVPTTTLPTSTGEAASPSSVAGPAKVSDAKDDDDDGRSLLVVGLAIGAAVAAWGAFAAGSAFRRRRD